MSGSRTELFDLFEKFVLQDKSNFLIVPMQTGSGKTYTAVQFMLDFIEDRKKAKNDRKYPYKRIVYTTGLRNNLPWKDLQEELNEKDYNKHVLVVKPNAESLEYGFNNCSENKRKGLNNLHLLSKKELWGILRKLKDARENLQTANDMYSDRQMTVEEKRNREKIIQLANDTIENTLDNLRKKETEFRREVRKEFFNSVKEFLHHKRDDPEIRVMSPEERLEWARKKVLLQSKWEWLSEFYPVCRTYDTDIVFMSITKMIMVYDTIIGPKNLLYNSDFTDDTLFIIDEIDAAKTMMVSNLLGDDKTAKFRIDPTELFRAIHKSLLDRDNHPPIFYESFSKEGNNRLIEYAENVLKSSEDLIKKFNLSKRFYLENGEGQRFIFHDYRAIAISGGLPVYKPFRGKNYIDLDFEGKKTDEHITLEALFSNLNRFFSYFASLIRALAFNYKQREEAEGKLCPIDMATRSILDGFELPSLYDQYIEMLVLKLNQKSRNYRFDNDSSFYNLGFRHYEVESSREHGETSKLYQTAYDITPEKIIMLLLSHKNAKIIGISATATIYSVISNFDVEYLYSDDSSCKLYELNEEELSRLRMMYKRATSGYKDNLHIHVIPITSKNKSVSDIISDSILSSEMDDCLDDAVRRYKAQGNNNDSGYVKERYLRFALAYKEFIKKSRPSDGVSPIYSELALFNISVKDDPSFENSTLRNICSTILSDIEGDEPDLKEVPFMVLRGKDKFDESFEAITKRLQSGKKVFIVSTYPTVGSGQNLQYAPPECQKTVKVNDFDLSDKKDIDAIYLDNITQLVPFVRKGEYKDRDEYIYDIEELSERGELTSTEANQHINSAFERCVGNRAMIRSVKQTDSVILTCIRSIAQGVGRITRTNRKNADVYIFADVNLSQFFRKPLDCCGKLRSIEFEELYRVMSRIKVQQNDRERFEESKDMASSKASKRINAMLEGIREGRKESIEEYDALGDMVLRHPVCDSFLDGSRFPSIKVPTFYTRLSEPADMMTYKVGEHDRDNSYSDVITETDEGSEVSMADCNLLSMMRYRIIREKFKEKGYATGFSVGHFIMAPSTYNRIYKGRLGEAAGRILLEDLGYVPIRMDDNVYEKFDDKLKDGIYIDYKNWKTRRTPEEDEEEINKAFNKLSELNGRILVVMNIVKPDWDMPPVSTIKRDGMCIVQIAYMIDETNTINSEAVAILERCLSESSEERR